MEKVTALVKNQRTTFNELAATHKAVTFSQECEFALQALQNNRFLASTAERVPESLKAAILNVASAGITLNPIKKHAYLVPRSGKVCLDVSYRGLIHLASEGGAISWVQAYVVHEKDTFAFKGVGERPVHEFNPFGKRGPIVGVYSVAKIKDKSFLTEMMNMEQIEQVRTYSEAWKAYESGKTKQCPWVDFKEEMYKKAVIKRASKLFPKTDGGLRLETAIAADDEGLGFSFQEEEKEKVEITPVIDYNQKAKKIEQIKTILSERTQGMDIQQKGAFMHKMLKVSSFNDLKTKRIAELDQYLKDLSEVREERKEEEKKFKTAKDVSFKLG